MKTVLRNSYSPKVGDYCETLVVDLEKKAKYLFDCDGVFTAIGGGLSKEVEEAIEAAEAEANGYTDTEVGIEKAAREAADNDIWTEIEALEAASDVVDVVGTYADLQQYDTSKLNNNDLIKVLQDETRDDAITYYRWSTTTNTFTYVGSEGPYYTASETDTLLAGKQDKLIAGSNITIAADGKTISATDTTYTHFTGATASADGTQGLVPGPLAGDENKVLKGDGTWGTVQSATQTIFYMNASESGSTRHLYKSSDMTGLVTMQDIIDANEDGQVIVRISTSVDPSTYSDMYLQNAYVATGDYQMIFLDNQYYYSFDATQTSDNIFQFAKSEVQRKLTAGTNIQINGNTISATDTTYSAFTGATSQLAGTSGLVPAPAAGDENKVLKGDGTWKDEDSEEVILYISDEPEIALPAGGGHIYSDSGSQNAMTWSDINALFGTSDGRPKDVYLYINNSSDAMYRVVGCYSGDDNFVIARYSLYTDELDFFEIDATSGDPTQSLFTATQFTAQKKLTAGSNITISGSTISATDTTYSNFMGATSVTDGNAGLVPQPLIADKDKYLKGDGTWATVQAGPTVVQTTGQSTTDVMSQKAVTDIIGDVESALQILNSGAGVP